MTQQAQSAEEKSRLKKQWTDLAIQQALASQWEEAVTTNRNILNIFPTEPDAYNRLVITGLCLAERLTGAPSPGTLPGGQVMR